MPVESGPRVLRDRLLPQFIQKSAKKRGNNKGEKARARAGGGLKWSLVKGGWHSRAKQIRAHQPQKLRVENLGFIGTLVKLPRDPLWRRKDVSNAARVSRPLISARENTGCARKANCNNPFRKEEPKLENWTLSPTVRRRRAADGDV